MQNIDYTTTRHKVICPYEERDGKVGI